MSNAGLLSQHEMQQEFLFISMDSNDAQHSEISPVPSNGIQFDMHHVIGLQNQYISYDKICDEARVAKEVEVREKQIRKEFEKQDFHEKKGMLQVFPPSSVKLRRPFGIQPWVDSDENIANLLMLCNPTSAIQSSFLDIVLHCWLKLQAWRFLITFADVLGLWPFTLEEFVQALHDYVLSLEGGRGLTIHEVASKIQVYAFYVDDAESDEDTEDADDDPEVDDAGMDPTLGKNDLFGSKLKDPRMYTSLGKGKGGDTEDTLLITFGNVEKVPPNPCSDNLKTVGISGAAEHTDASLKYHESANPDMEDTEIHESNFGEPWVQGLSEGDYCELSVQERLNALVSLIGIAIDGNSIRAVLEERIEAATALKKCGQKHN
ncbi:hypothetical protein ZIOFF_062176 [Zingiber officinale]|uniref:Uncharacterized protein n=1 Tax=Zingiber officinale TaxID=94328 RepID=A0A8J5F009_ZINOF|nr:hypothetical protein ZIOFF_062176 [Zingiber officinale]